MEFETPNEYAEKFEERASEYTTEKFGARQEFLESEMAHFNMELYELDASPENDISFSPELHELASKVGWTKYRNVCKRKLEFLEKQKSGKVNIEILEKQLKFKSNTDLLELAQALVSANIWQGTRKDLIALLKYLSGRKINSERQALKDLKERKETAKFLGSLISDLESWKSE